MGCFVMVGDAAVCFLGLWCGFFYEVSFVFSAVEAAVAVCVVGGSLVRGIGTGVAFGDCGIFL